MNKKIFAIATAILTVLAIAAPITAQPLAPQQMAPPQKAPQLSGWAHFDHGVLFFMRNGVRYAKVWDAYSMNRGRHVRVLVRTFRWSPTLKWVMFSGHWNHLIKTNPLLLRKMINGKTSTIMYHPTARNYYNTHKIECRM